jgi:hypothetical protein
VLRTPTLRTEYKGAHAEGLEHLFVSLPDALARRKMIDRLEKTHAKLLARESGPDVDQSTAAQAAALASQVHPDSALPSAAPLHSCAANRDGECGHPHCPQLRDNEPATSGRHCPLDHERKDDAK